MNIKMSNILLFLGDYESKKISDNFFVKRFASRVLWNYHFSEGSKFRGVKPILLADFNNHYNDESKTAFINWSLEVSLTYLRGLEVSELEEEDMPVM